GSVKTVADVLRTGARIRRHNGRGVALLCEDMAVPRLSTLGRRGGALGIALTAWDLWRRLPPRQRKQVVRLARKHGPKVAARVMKAGASARGRRAPTKH